MHADFLMAIKRNFDNLLTALLYKIDTLGLLYARKDDKFMIWQSIIRLYNNIAFNHSGVGTYVVIFVQNGQKVEISLIYVSVDKGSS